MSAPAPTDVSAAAAPGVQAGATAVSDPPAPSEGVLRDLAARLELAESARLARAGRYAEADAALTVARAAPAGLDLRARIAAQQGRLAEAAALWREAADRLGTPGAFDHEIATAAGWPWRRRPARRAAALVAPVVLGLAVGGWVGRAWSSVDPEALEGLRADVHDTLDGLDARADDIRRSERALAERLDELAGDPVSLRDRLDAIAGIEVRDDRGTLRVRFDRPAFGAGVTLSPAGRAALAAIGGAVGPDARRHLVVVTGHTDPLPVRPGGRFADNDELALARALTGADALAAGGLPTDATALRASAAGPRERTLTLAIVPRR